MADSMAAAFQRMADQAAPSEQQQQKEADHGRRENQRKRQNAVDPCTQIPTHPVHKERRKQAEKERSNRGRAGCGKGNVQRRQIGRQRHGVAIVNPYLTNMVAAPGLPRKSANLRAAAWLWLPFSTAAG